MKTFLFEHHNASWRHELQTGLTTVETRSHHSWRHSLQRVGQQVLDWLTLSNSDPHIWVSHNQTGEAQWNAYDPLSGRRIIRATEPEIRVWLEERYNYQ